MQMHLRVMKHLKTVINYYRLNKSHLDKIIK